MKLAFPTFPSVGSVVKKAAQLLPLPSRAISVILGDKWKKMKSEERRMYTMEAKALAEEQKRLNPDCWKRKRTNSVRTESVIITVWGSLDPDSPCGLSTGLSTDLNNPPEASAAGAETRRGAGGVRPTARCLFTLLYSWDSTVMLNLLAFYNLEILVRKKKFKNRITEL